MRGRNAARPLGSAPQIRLLVEHELHHGPEGILHERLGNAIRGPLRRWVSRGAPPPPGARQARLPQTPCLASSRSLPARQRHANIFEPASRPGRAPVPLSYTAYAWTTFSRIVCLCIAARASEDGGYARRLCLRVRVHQPAPTHFSFAMAKYLSSAGNVRGTCATQRSAADEGCRAHAASALHCAAATAIAARSLTSLRMLLSYGLSQNTIFCTSPFVNAPVPRYRRALA
jgi:hypothetical protein